MPQVTAGAAYAGGGQVLSQGTFPWRQKYAADFFFPRAWHPLAPPLPLPPLSFHLPTFGSLLARVTSRGGGPRSLSSESARHGQRIG